MSRRSAPAWLWAASLAAGLGITALRHLPDDPPFGAFEDALIDLRFHIRGPRPAPESVLIVAIDDASLDAIGLMAPMREALATAIERLEAAGAGCIVVDMLLVEPTSADARLARVLSSSPSAVLAVAAVPGVVEPVPPPIEAALKRSAFPVVVDLGTRPWSAWRLQMPTTPLALAARTLGHVNIALSADRVARRVPLAVQVADGDTLLPSAALIAAHRLRGDAPGELRLERGRSVQLGDVRVPTDQAGQVLLDLYGGPRTLATVSLDALLAGEIAPDRLKGRAVFIGAGAATLGDTFATSLAPDVAGVEILGTLAANLLDDDLIAAGRTVWAGTTLAVLAFAALAGLAVSVPASPFLGAAATLGIWLVALAALQLAFNARHALDATSVIAAVVLASAVHWLRRLRADQIGRRDLEAERARLSSYMSPFAATILPPGRTAPLWRTEPATIGFVDVAGSVGLAEARTPRETAAYLALVQGHIARAVARHGGAVVERAGDGALVVFGFGSAGGAREALDFASDVVGGAPEGAGMRVSLQHGPVALADLGGGTWGHVALAGDTVNVAARLQDAAKRSGSPVVAGRAVLDAAGVDLEASPTSLRPLPPEVVRGRREPVEVWALVV